VTAPPYPFGLSRDLARIVRLLERGELETALAQLAAEESAAFLAGSSLAGELAYARWRAAGGDVPGAIETLRALVARRRR
jgi:hypothetical protein